MGLFRQSNSKKAAELLDKYQKQFRDQIAALPRVMANGKPTPKAKLTKQCDVVSHWAGSAFLGEGIHADLAKALADTLRQNIFLIDDAHVEEWSAEVLALNLYSQATSADWVRAQYGAELKPVLDAYFYVGRLSLDNIASTKTGKLALGLMRWCATKDIEGDLGQPPIPLAGWYWDPQGSNRYRRSNGKKWTNEFSDNPNPK